MPLFGFGKKKASEPERPTGDAGVYEGLRGMVLGLGPSEAGAEPSADLPRVWGVIVDWGTDIGTATFVALADGTSSMYTSTGGGVIGAGEHEPVRAANRALLLAAEAALDELTPVNGATRPELQRVSYWVRTYDGIRMATHGNGPPAGPASLAALADAFQDFVTAVRIAESTRS